MTPVESWFFLSAYLVGFIALVLKLDAYYGRKRDARNRQRDLAVWSLSRRRELHAVADIARARRIVRGEQ